MRPDLSSNNVANVLLAYAENLGYHPLPHAFIVFLTHKPDYFIIYLGIVALFSHDRFAIPCMTCAFSYIQPTFVSGIDSIDPSVTKKQMRRIAAWRIVALVKDITFKWVHSSVKKKRYSVRANGYAISRRIAPSGKTPISIDLGVSEPWPALVRPFFFDHAPECLNMLICKPWHWFTLIFSHLISSIDRWLGPRVVYETSRGSFYFTLEKAVLVP